MQPRLQPTSEANIRTRLFLRFFLLYFGGALLTLALFGRGFLLAGAKDFALTEFLFVPLSLLAAVLTLAKPYLLVLTLVKAFCDTAFLMQLFRGVRGGSGSFWGFNAHLLYLSFTLLLFCLAASYACLFSFHSTKRDAGLLFSLHFIKFLARAAFLASLALLLYFLFPQIKALL